MNHNALISELSLNGNVFSFRRLAGVTGEPLKGGGCDMKRLAALLPGESIVLTAKNATCGGAMRGVGFSDEEPNIPGGFGEFIAHGANVPGAPHGEHIKCSPEVAIGMLAAQPANVMQGYDAVAITRLGDDAEEELAKAELISFIANPDQISALIHLFGYRSPAYDNVIVPMSSGCASLFRIPFGEMLSGRGRAVVGNVDVVSRPPFPANTFFFTIPATAYRGILADAEESMLAAKFWLGVKKRLS